MLGDLRQTSGIVHRRWNFSEDSQEAARGRFPAGAGYVGQEPWLLQGQGDERRDSRPLFLSQWFPVIYHGQRV